MSFRKLPKSVRTRRLSLENLENRRVMAGNVLVGLSGHNLLITGDAADNAITVNAIPGIPGRINIQPGGDLTTTINGKSNPIVLNFPSFQDIRFSLGGGDDTLDFIGDAGATDSLIGSLVVDGGLGDNTINISDYDVGANVTISNGSGSDAVTLTNVHAGNDITINNGAAGENEQATALLEGTSAGRDVRISNLNGTNRIDFGGAAAVTIGRDLYLTNLGAGPTDAVTISLDNVTISNNLSFTNRPVATIVLGGEISSVTVAHNTTIRNGVGDNNISLENGSSFGSTASDRLSITNGAGNNVVFFSGVSINGATDVRNGAGDANIVAQGSTVFNGSVNIVTGATGTHEITLRDGEIQGSLSIFNGTATDNSISLGTADTLLITGNTFLSNGNATNNTVTVDDATLLGNVTITNGTATNSVNLGNAGAGTVLLGPKTAIYNISGPSSTVNLDSVTTTGTVSLRHTGTGTNTMNFGVNAGVSTGALSVNVLGGAATVTLDQLTVTGNALIQTSGGNDAINLGSAGAAGLSITGNTTVITGAGNDTLLIGAGAGGTVSLGGFLLVQMGAGTDNCTIGTKTSKLAGTAIATRSFLFDGGNDPIGTNTITVNTVVIDPAVDLATFNKFRKFVIITIP